MQASAGRSLVQQAIASGDRPTLLCFSHLRWGFVFQRPQHLLTRAARTMRVLYWEEPFWTDGAPPSVETHMADEGVMVVQPHIPGGCDPAQAQRELLDAFIRDRGAADPLLWYYTPQALEFSDHLRGRATVYDCMDELAAFAGADPSLPEHERRLMQRADLVFTGGHSLYEAKRHLHGSVHAFQSGVDAAHFMPARHGLADPADQSSIPRPRVGFYGVLDERLDRGLLAALADLRPGVQFVLVGPIAKLDFDELPQRGNVHYLGPKDYDELPAYAANWQAAMMPFAINAATRFISPTKTPEYLAAGLPVVSTPIADVIRQYGQVPGVQAAATPEGFADCIDQALMQAQRPEAWRPGADAVLGGMSWDSIWEKMAAMIAGVCGARRTCAAVNGATGADGKYDYLIAAAGFAEAVLAER